MNRSPEAATWLGCALFARSWFVAMGNNRAGRLRLLERRPTVRARVSANKPAGSADDEPRETNGVQYLARFQSKNNEHNSLKLWYCKSAGTRSARIQ